MDTGDNDRILYSKYLKFRHYGRGRKHVLDGENNNLKGTVWQCSLYREFVRLDSWLLE